MTILDNEIIDIPEIHDITKYKMEYQKDCISEAIKDLTRLLDEIIEDEKYPYMQICPPINSSINLLKIVYNRMKRCNRDMFPIGELAN